MQGVRFNVVFPIDFTPADLYKAVGLKLYSNFTPPVDQLDCDNWSVFPFKLLYCGKTIPSSISKPDDKAKFDEMKMTMTTKSNILVTENMCGGAGGFGVDFVDLCNTDGFKKYQWNHNGPEWRHARHGLCLEGNCGNASCKAYQKQVVIPIGFGKLDLLIDSIDRSKCPMCSKYVQPITCSFNNCRWRWHGIKQAQSGMSPEKVSADWKIADDAYHIFDQNVSGKVVWLQLIIEAQKT